MVKITPTIPSRNVTPVQGPNQVEPVTESAADKSITDKVEPVVERRKRHDRRRDADQRGAYEMRSGRDRRRNNRGKPIIDTDA